MATIRGTYGDDTLTGSASDDYIAGLRGDDVLYGHEGRDTLFGGAGNDTLYGGEDLSGDRLAGGRGNDVYFNVAGANHYGSYLDSVIEKRGGGTDTIIDLHSVTRTLPAGVENLVVYTSGVSYLRGNNLDNVITSVTSEHSVAELDGNSGNDTLIGGAGYETFRFSGDSGHDIVDGGTSRDELIFAHNHSVQVDFWTGTATGNIGHTTWSVAFTNIEMAKSSGGDDLLIGNDEGQLMWAGAGDDTIHGGAGNDWFSGGTGNNFVTGGAGNDTLSGHGTLEGGAGDDRVWGSHWEDQLLGGAGNDVLLLDMTDSRVDGGPGIDTLKAPSFLSSPEKFRSELIHDLTTKADGQYTDIERIDLYNLGGNAADTLILGEKEILALSSTTDTLVILGGSADAIDIVGSYTDEGIHDGYRRYQVGAATLLVDPDITNVS